VLDGTLWDTSWLLSEESWPGRVLHVLVGYVDHPTLMQALAYIATVAAIVLLATTRRASPAKETGSQTAGS
jgi:high-affinity iron transporter